jgi:Protein of unknown function (DUF2785)
MGALAENNMNCTAAASLMLAGILLTSTALAQTCPPAGMSRQQLVDLPAKEFAVADDARRQALALDLLACLGSTDPALRDKVAFEGLQAWMRGKQLSTATVGAIRDRLLPQLAADYPDSAGVLRPFAALVLAEVVRVDRIEAFMTDEQLQQVVDAAARYLPSIRDYRGFDDREGWRHAVAHGADLIVQLALNPRTSKLQLNQLLAALATQVAPPGDHFYVYGEGARLAMAVFYIAKRKLHTTDEWRKWLEQVTAPVPLANWEDAYKSERGMVKHHNTITFLAMLYLNVREGGADVEELVFPELVAVMKQMR